MGRAHHTNAATAAFPCQPQGGGCCLCNGRASAPPGRQLSSTTPAVVGGAGYTAQAEQCSWTQTYLGNGDPFLHNTVHAVGRKTQGRLDLVGSCLEAGRGTGMTWHMHAAPRSVLCQGPEPKPRAPPSSTTATTAAAAHARNTPAAGVVRLAPAACLAAAHGQGQRHTVDA